MKRLFSKILILCLLFSMNLFASGPQGPDVFFTTKPWTYWWWPGSAVNEKGITFQLEAYAKAGFGGLHIIPIYGAKGFEKEFLPYLSPAWERQFLFVLKEAKRLHLGIDMTLGTGWPFGGPQVSTKEAAKSFKIETISLAKGDKIPVISPQTTKQPDSKIISISIYDGSTFHKELYSEKEPTHYLTYSVKEEKPIIYVVYETFTQQKVKRAAPGGEGLVLDHFSKDAFNHYKKAFEPILKAANGNLRAIYSDSYEVYGANWTEHFWDIFQKENGYDLRTQLPVLVKEKVENEAENQIWADYHRTLGKLVKEEFTLSFNDFAHHSGVKSRDQAHGSPGNLIDLYASVDIPESEFFGSKPYPIPGYRIDPDYDSTTFGIPDIKIIKLASSPAHFLGKKLVTSETATWLGNHFKVSLAQVKPIVDEVFLGGVNHLFYHGATYSPPEVKWPGWLFYASTNFNYNSHFWGMLPELNAYIDRCQTKLQNSKSDSEVLLYFPIEDIWHAENGKGKIHTLDLHAKSKIWMKNTRFGYWADLFQNNGYQADYVSDELLKQIKLGPNRTFISPAGQSYKILFLPAVDYLSLETLERVSLWVKQGYPIYFLEHWPQNHNTFNWSNELEARWQDAVEHLKLKVIHDPRDVMQRHGVVRETNLSENNLTYFRKKTANGSLYFISNLSANVQDSEINLGKIRGGYRIFYPLTQKEIFGQISTKQKFLGLRLEPGESVFIENYSAKTGKKLELTNPYWRQEVVLEPNVEIDFMKGEPNLPQKLSFLNPEFWTVDSTTQYFSGTGKYTLKFKLDSLALKQSKFIQFTDIRDWAKVRLNGKELGNVWAIPFKLEVPANLLKEENVLELEVGNVSANRIRYLDQQKVLWKNFHEINFVNIRYESFDASKWPVEPAGFAGKINLSNR